MKLLDLGELDDLVELARRSPSGSCRASSPLRNTFSRPVRSGWKPVPTSSRLATRPRRSTRPVGRLRDPGEDLEQRRSCRRRCVRSRRGRRPARARTRRRAAPRSHSPPPPSRRTCAGRAAAGSCGSGATSCRASDAVRASSRSISAPIRYRFDKPSTRTEASAGSPLLMRCPRRRARPAGSRRARVSRA